jgi:hypothetical protein
MASLSVRLDSWIVGCLVVVVGVVVIIIIVVVGLLLVFVCYFRWFFLPFFLKVNSTTSAMQLIPL